MELLGDIILRDIAEFKTVVSIVGIVVFLILFFCIIHRIMMMIYLCWIPWVMVLLGDIILRDITGFKTVVSIVGIVAILLLVFFFIIHRIMMMIYLCWILWVVELLGDIILGAITGFKTVVSIVGIVVILMLVFCHRVMMMIYLCWILALLTNVSSFLLVMMAKSSFGIFTMVPKSTAFTIQYVFYKYAYGYLCMYGIKLLYA